MITMCDEMGEMRSNGLSAFKVLMFKLFYFALVVRYVLLALLIDHETISVDFTLPYFLSVTLRPSIVLFEVMAVIPALMAYTASCGSMVGQCWHELIIPNHTPGW